MERLSLNTAFSTRLLVPSKTPLFGYLLHHEEVRLQVLATNPTMTVESFCRVLENKWEGLSEEEKLDYAEKAKELNWQNLSGDEKNLYINHVKEMVTDLHQASYIEPNLTLHESPETDDDRPFKKTRIIQYNPLEQDDTLTNYTDYETSDDESFLGENNDYEHDYFQSPRSRFSEDGSLDSSASSIFDESSPTKRSTIGSIPKDLNNNPITYPKPPAPAFLHFSNHIKPILKVQFNGQTYGFITKLIRMKWESMTKRNRGIWERKAKEDEDRFEKERQLFLTNEKAKEQPQLLADVTSIATLATNLEDKENSASISRIKSSARRLVPIKPRPILPYPLQSRPLNTVDIISPSPIKPLSKLPISQTEQKELKVGLQVPISALNAYQHFCIKGHSEGHTNEFLNEKWNSLQMEERSAWERQAKKDEQRYMKEKETYMTNQFQRYLDSQLGQPFGDFFST